MTNKKRFGLIKRINKLNIKKVTENDPIVYGIFTNSGKLQKVGRAKRGRGQKRILESMQEIRDAKRQARQFSIIVTKTVEDAKKLETILIRKRKPPFNKEKKGK